MVDKSCHQFGGIDAAAAHLHKMDMAVFKSVLHQLRFIIDLSHGGDGKAAQVRLDKQRLRLIV